MKNIHCLRKDITIAKRCACASPERTARPAAVPAGCGRGTDSSCPPLLPGVLVIGDQAGSSRAGSAPICQRSAWCCLPATVPRDPAQRWRWRLREAAPGALAGSYRSALPAAPRPPGCLPSDRKAGCLWRANVVLHSHLPPLQTLPGAAKRCPKATASLSRGLTYLHPPDEPPICRGSNAVRERSAAHSCHKRMQHSKRCAKSTLAGSPHPCRTPCVGAGNTLPGMRCEPPASANVTVLSFVIKFATALLVDSRSKFTYGNMLCVLRYQYTFL